MAVKIQKPILVIGLGLSALLWLWDGIHNEIIALGEWGLLGGVALGGFFWLSKKPRLPQAAKLPLSPLKKEMVEKAIERVNSTIAVLESEIDIEEVDPAITTHLVQLKDAVSKLPEGFEREQLNVAIAGGKKVGKSSLQLTLQSLDLREKTTWLDTDALFTENTLIHSQTETEIRHCDLVLFLTGEDVTESERQFLAQLQHVYQRVLLVWNKQDQYSAEERLEVRQLLWQRVKTFIALDDVIPIAAAPHPITVRRHQADGVITETQEQPPVQIAALEHRLIAVLTQEQRSLVWGTLWRQAIDLQQQTQTSLNQLRRTRAIPVIEQYQWIGAAAAFANPVAALDLLATAAITGQMLVDLSSIYQQKLSLSQAQAAAGTIGKLMVQLGLVELSSQAIAGLLKSNALTYVAGGMIQGVSAAYLTRLAGLSLIEYFQEESLNLDRQSEINWEKLGVKLKQAFQDNQRTAILQGFVRQAMGHLSTGSAA